MISRPYNFSPGPSMIPGPVIERAQSELLNWNNLGCSVMEVGHRSKPFTEMLEKTSESIRTILSVPKHYKILFMHGGAHGQFAAIPMNLLRGARTADYVPTGTWSQKAVKEAHRYCEVNVAATEEIIDGLLVVPDQDTWRLSKDAAYVYYCSNETISGLAFPYIPETGEVPLVCDMTSDIASYAFDISKYGLIYASTQKNLGIAGLTLVVVREDLLGQAAPITPCIFDYALLDKAHSVVNTIPTFACYMTNLFCDWIQSEGGVTALQKRNAKKAKTLYDVIDASDFYTNKVHPRFRSKMNVTFTLPSETLEARFLADAENAGLLYLKGHRSVGGIRASIYNAMPQSGVDQLADFMREFERSQG